MSPDSHLATSTRARPPDRWDKSTGRDRVPTCPAARPPSSRRRPLGVPFVPVVPVMEDLDMRRFQVMQLVLAPLTVAALVSGAATASAAVPA